MRLTSIILITILLVCCKKNSNLPDIKSGLVAYYPFSGNAGDSSGNKIDGLVSGAILSTDRFGKANSCYAFNRSTVNEINLKGSALLDSLRKNMTISLWVNLNSYGLAGESGYNHYINKSDQSSNHQFVFANNSTQLYFYYGSGASGFTANKLPPLKKWTHLAVTYSYNSTGFPSICKFYIDGVEVASFNTTVPMQFIPNNVKIGTLSTNNFNRLDGSIDDIRIYNRSLSSEQIKFLADN